MTPSTQDLYDACRTDDIVTVRAYLRYMDVPSIDQRVANGSTALHAASRNGHDEIVRLLLEAGASTSIMNVPSGLTRLEAARGQSTRDLFLSHRSRNNGAASSSDDDTPIEWVRKSPQPRK